MAMIELRDIHKTYGTGEVETHVLRGVSMTIGSGEFVALMGASGSGKSTLMNLLGCLDQPTSGEYWLDGEEVGRLSSDRRATLRSRKIGFVFQSFHLLPRTTALDNVLMPVAYAIDADAAERRRRAVALLERVGLGEKMMHEPAKLSGGQQQRVAVARALVNEPRLLLADEPTGALDSRASAALLAMLGELHAREHLSIVIVTHDDSVARHAQRIVRLRDGSVVEDAEAAATAGAGR
ncbi:MAG TPA: ABC transporter ATP-binding protein [Planctomycetota bacterium]|nr:ABC transporter ATP-binding protein [Planctomycetota bacterium]